MLRKLLLLLLFFLIFQFSYTDSFSYTDYYCYKECLEEFFSPSLCREVCSFSFFSDDYDQDDSVFSVPFIDKYLCILKCMEYHSYFFCERICSY